MISRVPSALQLNSSRALNIFAVFKLKWRDPPRLVILVYYYVALDPGSRGLRWVGLPLKSVSNYIHV